MKKLLKYCLFGLIVSVPLNAQTARGNDERGSAFDDESAVVWISNKDRTLQEEKERLMERILEGLREEQRRLLEAADTVAAEAVTQAPLPEHVIDSLTSDLDEVLFASGLTLLDPDDEQIQGGARWFVEEHRKAAANILTRWNGREKVFRQIFRKYGIPEQLSALCIIESAMNETAVSRAGATGAWQLMPQTARDYGLRVDGLVDERLDAVLSCAAAARHLRDLRGMLGSWELAVAAYNCGPGNVRKAMKKAESDRFEKIRRYLPSETRGYLPMLAGALLLTQKAARYDIHPESGGTRKYRTFTVKENTTWSQAAEAFKVDAKTLRKYNPQYISAYIPGTAEKPCIIRIPKK